jgi:hypothetical protein
MTYPNDRDERKLVYDDNESGGYGIMAIGAALLLALIVGVFMWNGEPQQTAMNDRGTTLNDRATSSSTVTPPVTQPAPNAAPAAPDTSQPNQQPAQPAQ